VLSPQYLIWLIGLSALCLAENGPARRRTEAGSGRRGTLMATPARMVMACTLVSQLEFPILFLQVMHHGFLGTAVVAARNLVLLAATIIALRKLWTATTAVADDPARPQPTDSETSAVPAARSAAGAPAETAAATEESNGDLVALQPAGASPASPGGEPRGASTT
jgi:hypothetical protein